MRKTCWFIVFLIMPMLMQAQHYFEAGVKAGVAAWNAQTNYISPQPNMHAGIELAYAYHSPQVVGFRTGLSIDRHQTAFGKHNYEDSYQTIDVDGQLMQIDYTIGNLTETYSMWSVTIPVQLTFSWDQFNLAVGPKIAFPLVAQWREKAANAALSVYYPDYDNRVYDSYPLAASRNFDESAQGNLAMPKIQYWMASEVTYNLPINTYQRNMNFYLTIGVYFDYSFSKVPVEHTDIESLIMLSDTRDGFPLHRILSPVLTSCRQSSPLVSRCALYDVGIKLSYTFSPYNPFSRSARTCNCW